MTWMQWFVVAGIAWTVLLAFVWCLLVVASRADDDVPFDWQDDWLDLMELDPREEVAVPKSSSVPGSTVTSSGESGSPRAASAAASPRWFPSRASGPASHDDAPDSPPL